MNILIDANIFLAVIMNEPEKKAIIRATRESELISPEILPYEIGNALTAMIKRKRINSKNVADLFSIYNSIPIRLVSVEIEKALEIAVEYNIYAYDAYYLEVAKRLKLKILTLDAKMKKVANDLSLNIMEF